MAQRSAWVVGASSGLGRAAAVDLLGRGWDVTVSARPGRLDESVARLRRVRADARVDALPLDVTDSDAIAAAVSTLREPARLPDAVVLSGGGPPPSQVDGLTLDAMHDAYRLVLRPVAQVVATLAPAMAARGRGVFVVVTSSGVKEPIAGLVTSNVMRAGVTALVKSAADEFAGRGVRLVCVAPGRIATDRVASLDRAAAERTGIAADEIAARSRRAIPAGRYGDPEEFGKVIGFCCSDDASYVTGVTISVDGGKNRGLLS